MAKIKKTIIIECTANKDFGFDGFKSYIDNFSYNRFLGEQVESEIEDYHTADGIDLNFNDFRVCDAVGFRNDVCKAWCDGLQETIGNDYNGNSCRVYYNKHTPFEISFTLSLPIDLLNEILRNNVLNKNVAEYIKMKFGKNSLLYGFMEDDYIKWEEYINAYCENGVDKTPYGNIDEYIWLSVWYWLAFVKYGDDDIESGINQKIGEEIDFGLYIELTKNGRMKVNAKRD